MSPRWVIASVATAVIIAAAVGPTRLVGNRTDDPVPAPIELRVSTPDIPPASVDIPADSDRGAEPVLPPLPERSGQPPAAVPTTPPPRPPDAGTRRSDDADDDDGDDDDDDDDDD